MADEFFRPFFTNAVWAQGEVPPGLWYNAVLGNNNSALGIKATDLDRKLSYGGAAWWMPTTHEFGPRGAYGDWENHDKVATRFGLATPRVRKTGRSIRHHRTFKQHHYEIGRQFKCVRHGVAGAGRHRTGCRLPYTLDRRGDQVQGILPAGRILQPLARQICRRRAAAREVYS